MRISRFFIAGLLLMMFAYAKSQPINRQDWVSRHNVHLTAINPLSPLSVGNGDFAFTADITGLQSFENYYWKNGIPLETMCTWAWHAFPNVKKLELTQAMKEIDFHGRKIAYASEEKTVAGDYFRQNPHPVALGQISLVKRNGDSLQLSEISHIDQELDMWKGLITSNYQVDESPVSVETVCHPDQSAVAFSIKSGLLATGKLKIALRFPYSYDLSIKNKPPFDWTGAGSHQTIVISKGSNKVLLKRIIDTTVYFVCVTWQGKAVFNEDAKHRFSLDATGAEELQVACSFSPEPPVGVQPSFTTTRDASSNSWKDYWTKGGAVDLSGSTDPRAGELERRMVLSLYLMKINYAGSFPPQETGLTHISWYGKHNSEVYWWHAAQFYQWGHAELLEKSFQWYRKILPVAIQEAKREGFEGARWPKMAGIDGRTSPGSINPFIIWNQPNPIYLAELVYRSHPDAAILAKYRDIVFESAKFLASYAFYDSSTSRYILGPPIKSVNECTAENTTQNPSFELAQWYYGLQVAQEWRKRLGMPREKKWDDILKKLSRLTIKDGKYLEMETDPGMYSRTGGFSSAMIMGLGYLPATPMIDTAVMLNTFNAIYERNGLRSFVSWSLGKGALTAARLGERQKAINILCNEQPGAHFLPNGHVQRAKEPLGCAAYLPANSAFLAAAALMAGGWDGAPAGNAPGFPKDGGWKVRVEGMQPLP